MMLGKAVLWVPISFVLFACGGSFDIEGEVSNNTPGTVGDNAAYVFFPRGACESNDIEVWVNGSAHPDEQYVRPDHDCLAIDTMAMSTVQVRCVDRTGARTSSGWQGPPVDAGAGQDADTLCQHYLN